MVRSEHQRPNRCHRIFWDLSLVRNQATARHSQRREGTGRFTPLDIHLYFNLSPFHRKKKKCQTLSEESLPRWMGTCFRWAYVIINLQSLTNRQQVSLKKTKKKSAPLFLNINRRRLRQQEERKKYLWKKIFKFSFRDVSWNFVNKIKILLIK